MSNMTREEAALILHPDTTIQALDAMYFGEYEKRIELVEQACQMGAEALRGPVPDPVTGLLPCGCGGKAKIWPSGSTQFTKVITDYEVGCTECAMTTGWVLGKQEHAIKVWNTAMGWKGGT